MFRFIILLVFIISSLSPVSQASAQTQTDNPVYIVQSGDTLGLIAQRFGISLDDLMKSNGITNPNFLALGTRLVIPGLSGVTGTLITRPIPLGETLQSISIRNGITLDQLVRINRITSLNEVFAGVNLIIPESSKTSSLVPCATLEKGQSPLEAAIIKNTSTWNITTALQSGSTSLLLPGDMIYLKSPDLKNEISPFSSKIKKITITPLPLVQGQTITIRVMTNEPLEINGSLSGNSLHFFEEKQNQYIALQGIHALAPPGLASFTMSLMSKDKSAVTFEENLLQKSGYFINDPPLTVDPATLDPSTTKPEEDQVKQIIQHATDTRYWNGKFQLPVDEPVCLQSTYGNRRSYNSSPFLYFHSGIDFGVCKNLNIYAPAAGKVVFAGPLIVRGNATIIDHGWGIYSGYWHQAEMGVKVGDVVKAGQLIGLVGKTGRVTGPHLHWEIIANGIQVEPWDWLEISYPQ